MKILCVVNNIILLHLRARLASFSTSSLSCNVECLSLFYAHYLPTLVEPAAGAGCVGQFGFPTLGTVGRIDRLQFIVGESVSLPGFGQFLVW